MLNNDLSDNSEAQRLRELIRELGLPLRRLPEIIHSNREQCLSWWSQHNEISINESHFSRLAGLVGIDENKLYSGKYDHHLARRRILGDYNSLPHRYQEGQNSFLRTSSHIFRYIVLTRGQWFADQVLSSLDVSPLIYQNTDQMINLTYFADLLEALSKKGFTQRELDTLASVMFLSLQETLLGQRFEEAENFSDVYSILAKNFSYFDSNFEYKSQFVGKKYVLTTTLPLDHHQSLKKTPANIQRLMRYRHILLAWFPHLAGLTPLFPTAEPIQHSDFVRTRYEFTLSTTP
ncbi:MAG TPA: hypothetical protein VN132_04140 [Bdellovibrio sp.]|nr:hypothetical protein [Bdellovibrio sp.]